MWPSPDEHPHREQPPGSSGEAAARGLRGQVLERLLRDADVDAGGVQVEAQNGVVLLKGSVPSVAAREAVSRAARDVPAVRDVCNMLIVTPRPGEAGRSSGDPATAGAVPSAFDAITAGLIEQEPSLGRSRPPVSAPAVRVAVAVSAGLSWALISIGMVVLGWVAVVLVSCAVASVAVNIAYRGRRGRGRDHGPPERRRWGKSHRPHSGTDRMRRQT